MISILVCIAPYCLFDRSSAENLGLDKDTKILRVQLENNNETNGTNYTKP